MEIASFDIETSNLNPDFGIVLCGVVKPWGKKAVTYRLTDYGEISSDDSKLVSALIDDLSQYLVVLAHNGVFFDRKFLNARAVKFDLPVLDPRGRFIDPVQVARKHLNLGSNRLDHLAAFLNTKHKKTPTTGDMRLNAVISHDKEAFEYIVEHCVKDVLVLEEVAQKLKPFIGRINEWGSA